jgi:uncharacterized membrane protein
MNRLQRAIFAIGAILILTMLVFPPWQYPSGYHFFYREGVQKVNAIQLFIQVFAVTIVTLFAYLAAKSRA